MKTITGELIHQWFNEHMREERGNEIILENYKQIKQTQRDAYETVARKANNYLQNSDTPLP